MNPNTNRYALNTVVFTIYETSNHENYIMFSGKIIEILNRGMYCIESFEPIPDPLMFDDDIIYYAHHNQISLTKQGCIDLIKERINRIEAIIKSESNVS